ncbi:MAG: hypothetical protein ABEJ99_00420 [Candidatus Nanohaloarchaea archaeon]
MPQLSAADKNTDYLFDDFSIDNNYNVLEISELHVFEEKPSARGHYCERIAEQVNDYASEYGIDEIWVVGDTGSFDQVYDFLDNLEVDADVKIVAGDEDKQQKNIHGENYTGFFRQIRNLEPFNTSIEYELFDEGFETEIEGWRIQAAHHPHEAHRDDELSFPDDRDPEFLENLFSVRPTTNQNSFDRITDRQGSADIFIYDHAHMPYSRRVIDGDNWKILKGLGGRRHNYQTDESLPSRSMHISSYAPDIVHHVHFDADTDNVFEHQIFSEEDGNWLENPIWGLSYDENRDEILVEDFLPGSSSSGKDVFFKLEFDPDNGTIYETPATRGDFSKMVMFNVEVPGKENPGYKPVQERFDSNHVRRELWETPDQLPPGWEN